VTTATININRTILGTTIRASHKPQRQIPSLKKLPPFITKNTPRQEQPVQPPRKGLNRLSSTISVHYKKFPAIIGLCTTFWIYPKGLPINTVLYNTAKRPGRITPPKNPIKTPRIATPYRPIWYLFYIKSPHKKPLPKLSIINTIPYKKFPAITGFRKK